MQTACKRYHKNREKMEVDGLMQDLDYPTSSISDNHHHRQLSTTTAGGGGVTSISGSGSGGSGGSTRDNDEGWVDSMVQVAHAANKLFSKHTCRMCQVYTDKQVEYETRQEAALRYHDGSPLDRVWNNSNLETAAAAAAYSYSEQLNIELYRQFLFDEESVVSSLSRHEQNQQQQGGGGVEEVEEDHHSVVTQRTQ